jgi:hypothetical protein
MVGEGGARGGLVEEEKGVAGVGEGGHRRWRRGSPEEEELIVGG